MGKQLLSGPGTHIDVYRNRWIERSAPEAAAKAIQKRNNLNPLRSAIPIPAYIPLSPLNTVPQQPVAPVQPIKPSLSGDSKADILWYESWNNGTAKVITTSASGTGKDTVNPWFSGFSKPDWSATGDFNGDGKTDIAWYEAWNNGTIKIVFSGGSGVSRIVNWIWGFAKPDWATVADFNGDGRADIGWYEGWNNGTFKVFLTNSSGNGVASSNVWFSGFSKPDYAAAGDFNGDGRADLVWYEQWNNGTAKLVYANGNGTGKGSIETWFSGFSKPDWAGVGDFNGDGKADLVWYEGWAGTVKVLVLNGIGGVWLSGFSKPDWAAVGDFNGDGKADIAWYEQWNNGTAKVFYSNGVGFPNSAVWFYGFRKSDWAAVG